MAEPLTPARFRALAEAYGSTIARWPEAEQGTAMAFAARPETQAMAQAILADADALDARLDRWRVPVPEPALTYRIIRDASRRRGPFMRAKLLWSGLGIAAALAGAAAGSVAAAAVTPADPPSDTNTVFGDIGDQTP